MHKKVIVHIDIDCFYAQVEEILDPSLHDVPMGIQQKTCLVTCNYKAREFGIKKLMYVPEAQKLCPDLVLVNGEDLTKYKKMSDQISSCLLKFAPNVEKLGLDENYIDVTEIVQSRLTEVDSNKIESTTFTLDIDSSELEPECDCGCHKRLLIGTHVAKELRQALFTELGITSCAGIAHNKLLAKLVGAQNKPNKQTVIFPHEATQFLSSLGPVRALCGIGSKTAEILEGLGVTTVEQLQNVDMSVLKKKFDEKMGERLKELALGIDRADVKPSGKQKTISIEDSTFSNPLKSVLEVETKLKVLLTRLVDAAIVEQKRTPTALRLTMRKTLNVKELLQRESRQKDVPQSFFKTPDSVTIVPLLFPIAIQLFRQIMNEETKFTITLVGVSFTKFLDQIHVGESNSLMKFLKPVPESVGVTNTPDSEPKSTKRKSGSEPKQEEATEPLPKKPKALFPVSKEAPKVTASDKEIKVAKVTQTTVTDFEIPKDLDAKEFNRLPIPVKRKIMLELKNASKNSIDPSLIDYPRKVEQKVVKNKMDAFIFKY